MSSSGAIVGLLSFEFSTMQENITWWQLRDRKGFLRVKQIVEHLDDNRLKLGKVLLYGIPNDLAVDAKILMNDFIAHSGNAFPGNLRVAIAQGSGDTFCSFANNFNGSGHSKNCFSIADKLLKAHAAHKLLCGGDRI